MVLGRRFAIVGEGRRGDGEEVELELRGVNQVIRLYSAELVRVVDSEGGSQGGASASVDFSLL